MTARFTLVGTGAMNSPRYRPAGLLVTWRGRRVMLDGGDGSAPEVPVDAWLVCDERAELMADIRTRARTLGVEACVDQWRADGIDISPHPVVHTSHPTFGYLVRVHDGRVVWAPEFLDFPDWAVGADLMFADAAGWERPIRFAHGTGGHAPVLRTAYLAHAYGVKRLVFAHIGRPAIRARDARAVLPFGEWGIEGRTYRLRSRPEPGRRGPT